DGVELPERLRRGLLRAEARLRAVAPVPLDRPAEAFRERCGRAPPEGVRGRLGIGDRLLLARPVGLRAEAEVPAADDRPNLLRDLAHRCELARADVERAPVGFGAGGARGRERRGDVVDVD